MAAIQRKLVHKQFNSPMGLYSQQNVKETLNRELNAFGAQGIEIDEQIQLNLANSAVLRAVEEEEQQQMKCGYKRVAWPPASEERIVREFTPQPQTQYPPVPAYQQQQQQQPSAAVPSTQQQYRAPSHDTYQQPQQPQYQQPPQQQQQQYSPQPQYQAPAPAQNQYQPQYQGQGQQVPQYQQQQQQPQYQPQVQAPQTQQYPQPPWVQQPQQPAQQQYQQPPWVQQPQQQQQQQQQQPPQQQYQQPQYQTPLNQYQAPHQQYQPQPQQNQFVSQPNQQFNSYSQPQQQQHTVSHDQLDNLKHPQQPAQSLPQDYRGASPGIITLRKEAPVTQKPAPVYTSQPAAVSYMGGNNMRGDLKWPPPEYKEAAVKENQERRELAAGPVCRPRQVKRDYTTFFAKNALSHHYPSYKVPPGTQHMTY